MSSIVAHTEIRWRSANQRAPKHGERILAIFEDSEAVRSGLFFNGYVIVDGTDDIPGSLELWAEWPDAPDMR